MTTPNELSEFVEIIDDADIVEISGVTTPAQEDALATIMKVAPDGAERKLRKAFLLLSSVNGHAHLITDSGEQGGTTSWDVAEGAESGHSHPYVRNSDGSYTIGDADGHKHKVLVLKSSEEELRKAGGEIVDILSRAHKQAAGATGDGHSGDNMSTNKGADDSAAKLEALEKRAEAAEALAKHHEAMAGLTDVEKAHRESLAEDKRDAFVALEPKVRKAAADAALAKAADADPVVYTTTDGLAIRKSAGDVTLALAKKADTNEKLAKAEQAKRENLELQKRAEDGMGQLPKSTNVHAAVLKALDGIEDEAVRKEAHEMVTASNSLFEKEYETVGRRGVTGDGDGPAEKLADLVKVRQTEQSGSTYEQAYTHVIMKTKEGRSLLNEMKKSETAH